MLSEVFGMFSGGVGMISVVLSCSGDLKDFWGGGRRYFQGDYFLFSCAWEY